MVPKVGGLVPLGPARLRGQGGAEGECSSELGSAFLVEGVDFGEGEAGGGQQVDDRAGEVTPAEEPLLYRLKAALPAPHRLVRGQPVLDEVPPSPRA